MFEDSGKLNSNLKYFYSTLSKIQNSAINEIFLKLKQDYNEDVGFYVSQENLEISNCVTEFDYKNAVVNLMRIINGFKVNPILITKSNIKKLDYVKVLFIPSALYMTTDEIENISQYLENGFVVADYLPGIVNENDGNLSQKIREYLKSNNVQKDIKNASLPNILLIGGVLSQNWDYIPEERIIDLINSVKEVLRKHEIKTIYGEDIDKWVDAKFYSYENRRIIAWMPNLSSNVSTSDKVEFQINLDGDYWVYDLNKGKVLKNGKAIKEKIDKYEPNFYTVLPYQVKEISVRHLDSVRAGDRIPVEVRVIKAKSSEKGSFVKHKIFVRLAGDKNLQNVIFNELIETDEEGKAILNIPTYLNQPAGWYFLEITDFYSNISSVSLLKIFQ